MSGGQTLDGYARTPYRDESSADVKQRAGVSQSSEPLSGYDVDRCSRRVRRSGDGIETMPVSPFSPRRGATTSAEPSAKLRAGVKDVTNREPECYRRTYAQVAEVTRAPSLETGDWPHLAGRAIKLGGRACVGDAVPQAE